MVRVPPKMSSAREDQVGTTRLRSNSKPNVEFVEEPDTAATFMDNDERKSSYFSPTKSPQFWRHHQYSARKPLINQCTNGWRQSSKWEDQQNSPADQFEDGLESLFARCLAILKAPKVRRYLLLYSVIFVFSLWLWSSTIWPVWAEQRKLSRSLSVQNRMMSGGVFGTNLRPTFPNMIQVKELDPRYLPKATGPKHQPADNVDRLIFVGDVHGCLDELKELLQKVQFNAERDHLITTGDLIARGPESSDVVDLVRELGASCVRGNHEDRILLIARSLNSSLLHLDEPGRSEVDNLDGQSSSSADHPDRALAKSLSIEQIAYLESCPVILRVGFMKHLAGDLVVVHAGLVPGIELEQQDPTLVMSMRSIDLATHVPSKYPDSKDSVPWFKLWDKYQRSLPAQWSGLPSHDTEKQKEEERHTTVIYGHDARKGLQLNLYSKGIDTGCVRGGKLTALVLGDAGAMQTVQVGCKDYRQRKPLKVEVEDVLRDGRVGALED